MLAGQKYHSKVLVAFVSQTEREGRERTWRREGEQQSSGRGGVVRSWKGCLGSLHPNQEPKGLGPD